MCMLGCGLCGDLVVLIFRRIVVDESRVTAAGWGPFDQFLITGHEDGTLAQYNITEVTLLSLHLLSLFPFLSFCLFPLPPTSALPSSFFPFLFLLLSLPPSPPRFTS